VRSRLLTLPAVDDKKFAIGLSCCDLIVSYLVAKEGSTFVISSLFCLLAIAWITAIEPQAFPTICFMKYTSLRSITFELEVVSVGLFSPSGSFFFSGIGRSRTKAMNESAIV